MKRRYIKEIMSVLTRHQQTQKRNRFAAGILHKYADSALLTKEEDAFRDAMVQKQFNFDLRGL